VSIPSTDGDISSHPSKWAYQLTLLADTASANAYYYGTKEYISLV